jgi:arylsulfatase A
VSGAREVLIMKKLVKVFFMLSGSAIVLGLLIGALRIAFYSQKDDPEHLAQKAAYLDKLAALPRPEHRPNIVLILFDDLGYGDIGAFGAKAIHTPHLDQLAGEGAKFTNYYSPAPNCTPSRAGMLTGRLPIHTGLSQVIFPHRTLLDNLLFRLTGKPDRLPTDEIVLPEILKQVGYSTKIIGKWHLGDYAPSLPNSFGFDEFFGTLYSNDMRPLALYHNQQIVEPDPLDQHKLTGNYTREAASFIAQNKEHPFFLYMAHNFPHIPLHSSAQQQGKSDGGLYGDVVEDLDCSVGEVVAALRANGVADNTLILIASDNGPWFQGSPGYHRGRKNDIFEGGMAVPFIVYWPGSAASGKTFEDIVSGLDIVPTVLDLLGLPAPTDRQIDGVSFKPMLLEGSPSQRQSLFYYSGNELFGVRDSRFKYQKRMMVAMGGMQSSKVGLGGPMGPWLFDMQQDPNESYDVSMKYPEQFGRLQQQFEQKARELAENPRGWIQAPPK